MPFEGVYSIIPTAFTDAGDFDPGSQRKVVDLFLDKGANGLTALGVTGEVARLEEHERATVLELVVKQVDGRVPIVAGTSADGTRTCIAYTRQAKALGAAAVMVSPPRMPKLNSNAVVAHYKALADAVDLPIVVQDYPPITGFAMEPALLARIAKEISSGGGRGCWGGARRRFRRRGPTSPKTRRPRSRPRAFSKRLPARPCRSSEG